MGSGRVVGISVDGVGECGECGWVRGSVSAAFLTSRFLESEIRLLVSKHYRFSPASSSRIYHPIGI